MSLAQAGHKMQLEKSLLEISSFFGQKYTPFHKISKITFIQIIFTATPTGNQSWRPGPLPNAHNLPHEQVNELTKWQLASLSLALVCCSEFQLKV